MSTIDAPPADSSAPSPPLPGANGTSLHLTPVVHNPAAPLPPAPLVGSDGQIKVGIEPSDIIICSAVMVFGVVLVYCGCNALYAGVCSINGKMSEHHVPWLKPLGEGRRLPGVNVEPL